MCRIVEIDAQSLEEINPNDLNDLSEKYIGID